MAQEVEAVTALSVFSGIGGFDLAAQMAGIKTVAMVEIEPFCQKVLAKNFPGVPVYNDVTTINGRTFAGVGIVFGGPPCPEFSQANKHAKGFDSERGRLVFEFLRVAAESGADWVVLENSARTVTTFREDFIGAFKSRGFEALPISLDSGSFHARKRGFYIANTDKVGGLQKLREVATLVQDDKRECAAPKQGGIEFVLRPNADPLFVAERDGEGVVAPVFCRENDAVPYRLDRVRALGNAVMPQQVYPILKAIAELAVRQPRRIA